MRAPLPAGRQASIPPVALGLERHVAHRPRHAQESHPLGLLLCGQYKVQIGNVALVDRAFHDLAHACLQEGRERTEIVFKGISRRGQRWSRESSGPSRAMRKWGQQDKGPGPTRTPQMPLRQVEGSCTFTASAASRM